MTAVFTGLLLLHSFALFVEAADPVPSADKKVVCYYNNWSYQRAEPYSLTPDKIDPFLCTHIIYAFADIDFQNNLVASLPEIDLDRRGYAMMTRLKMKNRRLKVMIGIGGWSGAMWGIGRVAANEVSRREFANNAVRFIRGYNFDGLALNWYSKDGAPEFLLLAKTLREEFEKEANQENKPGLLLSISIPHDAQLMPAYDIPAFNKFMDFMIVLAYDYQFPYENAVTHTSPLYSLNNDYDTNNINYTIQLYKYFADADKLIFGIPTYGRTYKIQQYLQDNVIGSYANGPGEKGPITQEDGWLAYYEICNFVKNGDWTVVQTKTGYAGPYAYKGDQWVCYDDIDMIKTKAAYAKQQGLGGVMFWTLDYDDFLGDCQGTAFPLIRTARDALIPVRERSLPKRIKEEPLKGLNSSSSKNDHPEAAASSGHLERATRVTQAKDPIPLQQPSAVHPTAGPPIQLSFNVPTSPPAIDTLSSRASLSVEDDSTDSHPTQKNVVADLLRLIEDSGGIMNFWNAIKQQAGASLHKSDESTEETPNLSPVVISVTNSTIYINTI